MKLKSLILGALMAVGLAASAHAQDDLLTGANVDEILNIARGYGSATLEKQSSGDPKITGKVAGVTYQVYFRNCTDNANCEDLNFYAGFLDLKPGLDVINDWNYNKRFSRAYLDSDQDACIEMDLDLQFGVTHDYMDSTFGLWTLVLDQYTTHIGYTK
jgi:Putative bacterial sensory transduction regulator